MKKQTFWKAMGSRKEPRFEEAQGYVIDLTDNYNYTVKIALDYRRPYWYATHYESGILCTPLPKEYKTKDELIAKLKEVDFKRCCEKNDTLNELKRQLDEIKNNAGGAV